jgi:hypothetical protein
LEGTLRIASASAYISENASVSQEIRVSLDGCHTERVMLGTGQFSSFKI